MTGVRLKKLRRPLEGELKCEAMCAATLGSDTLFFADPPNNVVRSFSFKQMQTQQAYRCGPNVELRALATVRSTPPPPGAGAVAGPADMLVVVERKVDTSDRSVHHQLVVCERGAPVAGESGCWHESARLPLESAPKVSDPRRIGLVSLAALPDGLVFAALVRSEKIDAFRLESSSTAYTPELRNNSASSSGKSLIPLPTITVNFQVFAFTAGEVGGVPLVFAAVAGEPYVKLLRVEASSISEAVTLVLIRRVKARCSRIIWHSGLLLCAKWHDESDSNAVKAWRVTAGGEHTERLGPILSEKESVNIHCWCSLGSRLALFDENREQLLLMNFLDQQ